MNKMTAVDWKWLNTMATGLPQTMMPKACQKKLTEMNYIIARYHDLSFVITGLGHEALRRRHFNLGPPEADDAAEQPAAAGAEEAEEGEAAIDAMD